MRQVLQHLQSGKLIVQDVPRPTPGAHQLLIQSEVSLISAGTERMLVDFARGSYLKKAKQQPEKVKQAWDKVKSDGLIPTVKAIQTKLGDPMPLGYSNVGRVVEVGEDVRNFAIGDRVVSNGRHAELVLVPELLAARVPEGVKSEDAAFTVVGAIGLQGIRLLRPTLGETFAVVGLGLIGLISVQLLKNSGCRVIGFDLNPDRIRRARDYSAVAFEAGEGSDPVRAALEATDGIGVDGVLVTAATKSDELMHQAAQMCRKRGRIVLTGVTGLSLQRADFYEKELTFQVSCSYGPGRYDPAYEQEGKDYPLPFERWTAQRNFEAVLSELAEERVEVQSLLSSNYEIQEAAKAYDEVATGDAIGVLLRYPQHSIDDLKARTIEHFTAPQHGAVEEIGISLIGAGNFARMRIGPTLAELSHPIPLVCSRTGLSASTLATKLRAERSTTEAGEVFRDHSTSAIIITTRHDSHASYVIQALEAGKHVFVEKPLCLNRNELEQIAAAYRERPAHIMVGFNRRFAPLVERMKQLIQKRSGPVSLSYLCNAGSLPEDHWLLDREIGGGRLIGEGCHFIDLAIDLIAEPVVQVSGAADQKFRAGKDGSFTLALEFENGSVASIQYFVDGSKKFSKEQITLFFEGRTLSLDNFRSLNGWDVTGFSKKRMLSQDKGHAAGLKRFLQAIKQGEQPVMEFESIYNTMDVVFRADDALRGA